MPHPVLTNGGTSKEWELENPILPANITGTESDTGRTKNGNGSSFWNSLTYTDEPSGPDILALAVSNAIKNSSKDENIGIDDSHNWGEQTAQQAGNGLLFYNDIGVTAYSNGIDIIPINSPKQLKNIAGALFINRQFDATVRYARGSNYYVLCDDIPESGIRVVVPNWYTDKFGDLTDKGTGAAITITASIESPVGVFTQVKFNGVAAGTVPNYDELVSDILMVSGKKGDLIGFKFWLNTPAGLHFTADRWSGAFGSTLEYSTTVLSDNTMIGSPSVATTSGYAFGITAIIASTDVKSAVAFGDSKCYGAEDTADSTLAIGNTCRALRANGVAEANFGVGGDLWLNIRTLGPKRLAAIKYFTNAIFQLGHNDIASTYQLEKIRSAVISTLKQVPANTGVFLCTPSPATTSTDGFVSPENQTVTAYEALRLSYDSFVRTLPYSIDGFFDIYAAESPLGADGITPTGKWRTPSMTSGVHESQNGAKLPVVYGTFNLNKLKAPGFIKKPFSPADQLIWSLQWLTAGSKTITIAPTQIDVRFTKQNGSVVTSFSGVTVAANDAIKFNTIMPENVQTITLVDCYGPVPNFSGMSSLTIVNITNCNFSGYLPDPKNLPLLNSYIFAQAATTFLPQKFPDFSHNASVTAISLSHCNLTGAIPNLSALTGLVSLIAPFNGLTDWTGGTLPATIKTINLHDNLLTAASVNAILAAAVASGGTGMTIALQSGNAAPTGKGITDKATLIAAGNSVTTS